MRENRDDEKMRDGVGREKERDKILFLFILQVSTMVETRLGKRQESGTPSGPHTPVEVIFGVF